MLTLGIALLGLAVAQLRSYAWLNQDLPLQLDWWMLAPAFAASEIFVIHYQFRREQYTFTLMELPLVLGLFFSTWPHLLVGRLVGGGLALRLHRKQAPMKLSFNLACNILETSVALVLFRWIAGNSDGTTFRAIVGAIGGVTVGVLVVTASIAAAISMYEGRLGSKHLGQLFVANLAIGLTNVSLALVAVSVLWVSESAGWLLLVVAVVLFLGYRSYARLQQKHDDLEMLYEFTRNSGRALQVESAMREILGQIANLLRAGRIELMVDTGSDRELVRTVLHENGSLEVRTSPMNELWERVALSGRPMLAAAPVRDRTLRDLLGAHDVEDAVAAPLRRADGSTMGVLLAGNRLGEMRTFTKDDLRLFEALANHASVSLENRHLIERLRSEAAEKEHQALHDALTGLPNRLLFQQRTERALALGRDRPSKVAVLLLDLNRFKEVNDTLGHHNGDLLLQEIADRLSRTLRAGDTVARLGGDEFAVLLPDLAGADAATAVAEGIRAALERPIVVGDLRLEVGASVGIAMWPDHGDDASVLLQRADVAMYSAKTTHKGVDLYDPAADNYSLERLALVGELRHAIDSGALAVHYQPKADTASGRITGAEALVRWDHPKLGMIPAEEIVTVAEQSGLIRSLTLWVLHEALQQCRRWRRDGHDFDVAVNLSFRNLLDGELADDVVAMLRELSLPASCLTFEITESSIMVDPTRTIAVLDRIKAIGIRLAIDDFGTGYSSFSHLRRLPVDEIKIDKSFVQNMAVDENDQVIVRSIVDLGRNLGLHVVAEGVEDTETWGQLAAVGCGSVQGYILTRPLPSNLLAQWIADQVSPVQSGEVVPLRTQAARTW